MKWSLYGSHRKKALWSEGSEAPRRLVRIFQIPEVLSVEDEILIPAVSYKAGLLGDLCRGSI
jgi:hypothetical protein